MNTLSQEITLKGLQAKFGKLFTDQELNHKAKLIFEINKLKLERNAIILGHNYMEQVLFHAIPDYTGDTLGLSRVAAKTEKDIIVFCGVRFMAETAKILSPQKTVLIPSAKAGCSLADGISADDLIKLKERYPGLPVITYANTSAGVKAESDICCTSGNAAAVVESFKDQTIIFIPDEYLARNIARETGMDIIFPDLAASETFRVNNKTMIGWKTRCEVHEKFSVEDIQSARTQFPGVKVLSHPECSVDVVAASDFCGSTTQIARYIQVTNAPHFLLLTECAMADNLMVSDPKKNILPICRVRCPHMDEINLENTLEALQQTRYIVEVPEKIRTRAYSAIKRMLEITPKAKV